MHTRPARKNRDTPGRRSSASASGPGSELKKTLFFRIIRGNCRLARAAAEAMHIDTTNMRYLRYPFSLSLSPPPLLCLSRELVERGMKIYRPWACVSERTKRGGRHRMNGSLKIGASTGPRSPPRRLEYFYVMITRTRPSFFPYEG